MHANRPARSRSLEQERSRLQELLKRATAEANAKKQAVELLSAEADRAKAALANAHQHGGGGAAGRPAGGAKELDSGLRSEKESKGTPEPSP